jgi:phage host-nuclease inhibitor protein Gam
MTEIESKAKAFHDARSLLAERVQNLRDEQEAIKRRLLLGVKNALAKFRDSHAQLLELVESHPELFKKPKTRTLHNVRVGWVKQRGKMEIEDAQRVVELIEKLLPEQAATLISTKKSPDKKALAELTARDLKRLGVSVTEDTEAPFVKPADDGIDKLLDALLSQDDLEGVAP